MGVQIYSLRAGSGKKLRIGSSVHSIGTLARLWKMTETDIQPDRIEYVEGLADAQAAGRKRQTLNVVVVEDTYHLGPNGDIAGSPVLGWDKGRAKTQDYDWDHLPKLGWAILGDDGVPVLHENVEGALVPMTDDRAIEKGIVGRDGRLAEQRLPTIIECFSVEKMGTTFYLADCRFSDGRRIEVLGESESGDMPTADWFVGQTPGGAANYNLADQVAHGSL